MLIEYINVFFLLLIFAVLSWVFFKIRRMDVVLWNFEALMERALIQQYRQIEALDSLKQLVRPNYPLPPTRDWAGSPDFLLEIAKYLLSQKPEHIVECSSGTSTVVLARCAQINGSGHVFSLEHDHVFAEKTRQQLQCHGLTSFATVIDAPLESIEINGEKFHWYCISNICIDTIDMLIIDGPPAYLESMARYPAGPLLFNRMPAGSAVFLDDAFRSGEREIVRKWSVENPSLRVEEISCEKGLVKLTT